MIKTFRYIFCGLVFCLIIVSNVFAYTSSTLSIWDSSTSRGYGELSNSVTFEQYLTLQNVKVRFTQDDTTYYFEITANANMSFSGIVNTQANIMNYLPCPILYKSENFGNQMKIVESCKIPYTDNKSGTFHTTSNVTVNSKVLSNYVYRYKLAGDYTTVEALNSGGNGEKYFIPIALRNNCGKKISTFQYATTYPDQCVNNGSGVSLIKNNSSSNYSYTNSLVIGYNGNYDIKIGINKTYIDDYRYLSFAETYVAVNSTNKTSQSENYSGLSICSNTIDLKEYVNCEHNWKYEVIDKLKHRAYCENCKWEKSEPHTLLYEYDGLKYNVCTCSYIDKVKYVFEINDDNIGTEIEICDSYEDYVKYPFSTKKGYNFKWYKKYEKELISYDNLSTVSNVTRTHFVATVSEFDKTAGNKSIIYKAIYSPIKFTFNYENTNNYNLNFSDSISPQVIYYDEIAHLKKNIDVRGYVFKGWTFDKGSNIIHLNKTQDVTNYTTDDLKELTIYPVYERMDYTIVYNSGDYSFSDGSKEKIVKYNFFDSGYLEQVTVNSSNKTIYGYVDDNGKLYTKLSDAQDEVERIGKTGTILNLRVSVGTIGTGGSEKPKPGMGNVISPTGNYPTYKDMTYSKDETSGYTVPSNYEETNYLYNHETYYYYRRISGMSDTYKDIVDEESNEEDDTRGKRIIATLSVANKWHKIDENSNNKLNMILELIRLNKMKFIFMMSLLFILLIVYEIVVINHYHLKSENDII